MATMPGRAVIHAICLGLFCLALCLLFWLNIVALIWLPRSEQQQKRPTCYLCSLTTQKIV